MHYLMQNKIKYIYTYTHRTHTYRTQKRCKRQSKYGLWGGGGGAWGIDGKRVGEMKHLMKSSKAGNGEGCGAMHRGVVVGTSGEVWFLGGGTFGWTWDEEKGVHHQHTHSTPESSGKIIAHNAHSSEIPCTSPHNGYAVCALSVLLTITLSTAAHWHSQTPCCDTARNKCYGHAQAPRSPSSRTQWALHHSFYTTELAVPKTTVTRGRQGFA